MNITANSTKPILRLKGVAAPSKPTAKAIPTTGIKYALKTAVDASVDLDPKHRKAPPKPSREDRKAAAIFELQRTHPGLTLVRKMKKEHEQEQEQEASEIWAAAQNPPSYAALCEMKKNID